MLVYMAVEQDFLTCYSGASLYCWSARVGALLPSLRIMTFISQNVNGGLNAACFSHIHCMT